VPGWEAALASGTGPDQWVAVLQGLEDLLADSGLAGWSWCWG